MPPTHLRLERDKPQDWTALSSRRRDRSPRRSARLVLFLFLGLWVALPMAPASAATGPLTATGTVTGELRSGQSLHVKLVVRHTGGWQKVQEVEVDLVLRGVALESVVVDPT